MPDQGINWLTAWELDPGLVIGLFLLLEAYLIGVGPARRRFQLGPPLRRSQFALFLTGFLVLTLALLSPLHLLGEVYLFSAHMVQHLLVTLVVPPLLILGTPGWLLRPLLRAPLVLPVARRITSPLIAFVLFNLAFIVWHFPQLYDMALQDRLVHVLEHWTFLGSAMIMWWPLCSPVSELPRLPALGQLLYLFLLSIPSKILGAILTFAPAPIYPTYEMAPRLWGIGVLSDQQIGGVIMWVPGGLALFVAFTVAFFLWLGREEAAPTVIVPGPGRWQGTGQARPEALATPPPPPPP